MFLKVRKNFKIRQNETVQSNRVPIRAGSY